MASTGEVACYGQNMSEAFLLALMSTGFKLPTKKKTILLAIGPDEQKESLVESVRTLSELGYVLYGTPGTAQYMVDRGIEVQVLHKPSSEKSPQAVDMIRAEDIELLINVPDSFNTVDATDGYQMRRAAVDFGVGLITNSKSAIALITAIQKVKEIPCLSLGDIYALGQPTRIYDKPLLSNTANRPRALSGGHGMRV
jgi:carbamoyl-phosphate synthase large subunit